MANFTSQHILNTSTNLLGFCLFVITSLHIANRSETHEVDKVTAVIAVLLTVTSVISFISIRTKNKRRERLFETIADYLFLSALVGILLIIILIALNLIKW
ncbi:hypothetical protein [Microbacter margulisiae]|uniref:Uncharacterized membrane protein (DUF4010 family) n=1 Tax=Microbacter margulisiae TaxID=1350067 RepID=A0A7W5H1D1_9PORP|nr:hypothetical protein [Microbacter margulisiae]MBB3186575.1 uncharacterized membrane protein (DUF4010 family) [Microbacter margulisiae]